jgi:hypothetical protein
LLECVQDGRFHRVHGLRVVDASIFPDVPSAAPNLTIIMAAEHIGAKAVNEEWNSRERKEILATDAPVLPPPIDRFVEAVNAGDTEAFLGLFPEDGVVDDWGRRFVGREAIRGWSDAEFIGAEGRMTVTGVEQTPGGVSVTADWESNRFTGPSRFTFVIDGERIKEMRITGAWAVPRSNWHSARDRKGQARGQSRAQLAHRVLVQPRRRRAAAGEVAHAFRHTYAKGLVARGGALPVVQQLLGHKDLKTTSVYLRMTVEVRRGRGRGARSPQSGARSPTGGLNRAICGPATNTSG